MHGTKVTQKVTSKHTVFPVCRLIRRQNDAFHILNIPPPNLHGFSDHAWVRSQIRHSRAFLQPLNNQALSFRMGPFGIPHSAFRTTKNHLSRLETCPFEAPSLTFRISKA